ncbi:MAG: biotin/lipoyl-binding protein [Bacteroidaceae bacterium]|nr:biotin/lipoyl-binding protein [Bacteroidaceae bacterium]
MKEFKFTIDGKQYNAAVNELEDNFAEVTINGKTYKVELEKEEAPAAAAVRRPAAAAAPAAAAPAGLMTVKSPLPGSIVKVLVKAGQAVKKGDVLLTMESMKMENNVAAEADGTVKAVYVEPGKTVMQDDKLLDLETAAAQAAPAPAPAPKAEAPKAEAPKAAPAPKAADVPAGGYKVTSPLPGSVIKVLVSEGQDVKKGDTLLTLESMKMENAIMADRDGKVTKIAVTAGQNVMQEDLLLVLG